MTTAVPQGDGARAGEASSGSAHRSMSRAGVAAVIDLTVLTAVDPAISATAVRDALAVLSSRPRSAPETLEPLVVLAHARAEVWRQLRARGVHADTAPDVRFDGEPLQALTPAERTALYLWRRCSLEDEDIAFVMDIGARAARRLRRRAAVALVRAVTALALVTDPTPCPIRDGIAARGAGMLSRSDVDALTMHAAECRVCVDWLRRADHHALEAYAAIEAPSDDAVDAVLQDLMHLETAARDRLVERAGVLRRDGRPPREPRLTGDPRRWLVRAAVLGVLSVVLVVLGLLGLSVQ